MSTIRAAPKPKFGATAWRAHSVSVPSVLWICPGSPKLAPAPRATDQPTEGRPVGMPRTTFIDGVGEVASKYKAVLLDQFGVLHDGKVTYSSATISAVQKLAEAGVKVYIISNSSRRSSGTIAKLAKLGFDASWFEGAVTSGDMAHSHLLDRQDDWWKELGSCCIHTTWSSRGSISLEGLGLTAVTDPAKADFILSHGTEAINTGGLDPTTGNPTTQDLSLDEFSALFIECANQGRHIPMVVANPDLVTVNGAELITMPGTFAKQYADLGGEVRLMGKPDPVIYKALLSALPGIRPHEMLAIGDSIEHDIRGAAAADVDSLFVGGGIHGRELGIPAEERESGLIDGTALEGLCTAMLPPGTTPTYAISFLRW